MWRPFKCPGPTCPFGHNLADTKGVCYNENCPRDGTCKKAHPPVKACPKGKKCDNLRKKTRFCTFAHPDKGETPKVCGDPRCYSGDRPYALCKRAHHETIHRPAAFKVNVCPELLGAWVDPNGKVEFHEKPPIVQGPEPTYCGYCGVYALPGLCNCGMVALEGQTIPQHAPGIWSHVPENCGQLWTPGTYPV